MGILILICAIPIIILNLWAVLDIAKASYTERRAKWLWTNVVLFFPLFGVFIYIFYGRKILFDSE